VRHAEPLAINTLKLLGAGRAPTRAPPGYLFKKLPQFLGEGKFFF